MAQDEIFEFEAIGENVLECVSLGSGVVALLHLAGAARRTLVFADKKIYIYGGLIIEGDSILGAFLTT